MIGIDQREKERIFQFIKECDLDYEIVDNGIIKPHLIAYDNQRFFFHKNEEQYIVVKYDKSKDREGTSGAYKYYTMKTLPQIMEQLRVYDESITKTFWEATSNSIDFPFDKVNYVDDWYSDLIKDEYYSIEEDTHCKYVVYSNDKYKPEIKSPFNTVGDDAWGSILHESKPEKIDKLYFEIHPVSTLEGRESYMLKILCNNEEILKEYITYRVIKRKGLRLLMKNIFDDAEKFKETK